MTLYVDTSALMKRYIDERDSDVAAELMLTDSVLVTSRLTEIEMRRNLTRLLEGDTLTDTRRQLQADLDAFALVALDATTCKAAAQVAEMTQCRSLDSIHIAAARRAGENTTLLTFDIRQAQAARSVGMTVVGV